MDAKILRGSQLFAIEKDGHMEMRVVMHHMGTRALFKTRFDDVKLLSDGSRK
ncbi:hypothetical protein [Pseudobacter ginsenosidimutans]|uniref:Uncharacterized protein n=1 Tax=Pseudobacter ginsenosidimutans TaxID=661488 RepID=A0A4Q7MV45_9BACT|nr:hypothetical protein [Pseudobacter ginsenosidimutans]RZS72537.1 hypothetical protein EV199_4458 [Pseudobacter ginsenosidimutans]